MLSCKRLGFFPYHPACKAKSSCLHVQMSWFSFLLPMSLCKCDQSLQTPLLKPFSLQCHVLMHVCLGESFFLITRWKPWKPWLLLFHFFKGARNVSSSILGFKWCGLGVCLCVICMQSCAYLCMDRCFIMYAWAHVCLCISSCLWLYTCVITLLLQAQLASSVHEHLAQVWLQPSRLPSQAMCVLVQRTTTTKSHTPCLANSYVSTSGPLCSDNVILVSQLLVWWKTRLLTCFCIVL